MMPSTSMRHQREFCDGNKNKGRFGPQDTSAQVPPETEEVLLDLEI